MNRKSLIFVTAIVSGLNIALYGCGDKKSEDANNSYNLQTESTKPIVTDSVLESTSESDASSEPTTNIDINNNSASSNKGLDSHEEVIDTYFEAFFEMNTDKIYSLFSTDELNYFNQFAHKNYTEETIPGILYPEMKKVEPELLAYSSEYWEICFDKVQDYKEELFNRMGAEVGEQYFSIGIQNIVRYKDCALSSVYEDVSSVICIEDEIACIQIDGKWYLSAFILASCKSE